MLCKGAHEWPKNPAMTGQYENLHYKEACYNKVVVYLVM